MSSPTSNKTILWNNETFSIENLAIFNEIYSINNTTVSLIKSSNSNKNFIYIVYIPIT